MYRLNLYGIRVVLYLEDKDNISTYAFDQKSSVIAKGQSMADLRSDLDSFLSKNNYELCSFEPSNKRLTLEGYVGDSKVQLECFFSTTNGSDLDGDLENSSFFDD